ncbi:MAG: type I-G CRISPR-associated protein Csb2 [Acidimicrobiales bacterium]
MSKAGDDHELAAFFSGRQRGASEWRRDGHRHPHFLPVDLDGDQMIDSAIVWCVDGFDERQLQAILRVRKLTSGIPKFRALRVFAESYGRIQELAPELCSESSRWKSVTPFAPYRHQKKESLEGFLCKEVDRELEAREIAGSVVSIDLVRRDWLSFVRRRPDPRERTQLAAWGIEIELSTSIQGPLALGALSHFGLGLFRPVDNEHAPT